MRIKLKRKNDKKFRFLKEKYDRKLDNPLNDLKKCDSVKYGGARVFQDDSMKKSDNQEPVVLCREGQEIVFTEDEKSVLLLGPKFCILKNLSEESFEREVEESIIKYRWELKK